MITPSRWFTGGRGLNDFRDEMLHDDQIRVLHDFPDASECFPGVEIKGGVSYFLWERDNHGDCEITTHQGNLKLTSTRPLIEDGMDVFIRDSRKIDILHKVQQLHEPLFYDIMSANDPFGYEYPSVVDKTKIPQEVLDYIDGDTTVFEAEPLERLAQEGQLMSYLHKGFWQCMDNVREMNLLETMFSNNTAPWKKW